MTKTKPSPSLQDLATRIDRLRAETGTKPAGLKADAAPKSGLGMAFAISTHLVAGLAVGGGIGYFLDQWLDTSPWFLIAFFMLGAAAGFLNVYRSATRYGMAVGYRPAEAHEAEADGKTRGGDDDKALKRPDGNNDKGA